jgi:hypothetical protein
MAEETAAATRVVHHTGAANRVRNLSLSLSLPEFSRLTFFVAAINACFPLQLLLPGRVIFGRDININQVNPVWKLKQLPDVGMPQSGAMV